MIICFNQMLFEKIDVLWKFRIMKKKAKKLKASGAKKMIFRSIKNKSR